MRQRIILVLALAMAVASVVFVNIVINMGRGDKSSDGPMVEVLVAERTIERGSIIDVSMIGRASIPEKLLHNNAVGVADQAMIRDQRAANTIPKGQILLWYDVDRGVSTTSLSNAIEKGFRAVSISVDQISGVSGHIRPDDWVDVLSTFIIPREFKVGADNMATKSSTGDNKDMMREIYSQIAGGGEMAEIRKVTMTLMQRVKVLAVGGITGQTSGFNIPGTGNMGAGPSGSLNNVNRMRQDALQGAVAGQGYRSITLLVEPIDAEILAFCADAGALSLALRNPEDTQVFSGETRLPKIILPDILDLEKSERVRTRPTPRAAAPTGPKLIE